MVICIIMVILVIRPRVALIVKFRVTLMVGQTRGREQTTRESREQRRENAIHAIILGKKKLENTADQKCIVIKLC